MNNGSKRIIEVTYYYLMDDLGSVLKVVDSSGTVKNSYSYDPYGNSVNKSETVTNPWQYAGGYYDANTGLYKFGTRYYDPQTGRWTQKDSEPSGNPYVYAGDEPTMQVDPSGKYSAYCIGSVAANIVVGGLSTGLTAFFAGKVAVGLIANAFALDADTATIASSLLAGFGAVAGFLIIAIGLALLAFVVYYLVTNVQRDCSGT